MAFHISDCHVCYQESFWVRGPTCNFDIRWPPERRPHKAPFCSRDLLDTGRRLGRIGCMWIWLRLWRIIVYRYFNVLRFEWCLGYSYGGVRLSGPIRTVDESIFGRYFLADGRKLQGKPRS